jgi:NAD(P)-dependent dehydrogenase (short-subunit alcohol dehydrogenase family)
MRHLIDLTKKKILVTGASSGIGRALCREIAGLGGNVALVGRKEAELAKTVSTMDRPSDHRSFSFDLGNVANIGELVPQIAAWDGAKIDGFVHAAGVEMTLPIKFVTPQKFDSLMRLHLYSFVEIIKWLANGYSPEGGASVVAISSVAAAAGGKCQTVYAASKGAVDAAIVPLAKELDEKNIRVNSIRPGLINTPMTERWAAKIGVEDVARLEAAQVLGLGRPEDVAHMACFLLSDAARFVTGRTLPVDGGGPRDAIF